MKEFIENLIGRLEERKTSGNPYDSYWDEAMYRATELANSTSNKTIDDVIEIVNQLAEEYNNGWIPVSSGNPKETGLYQVTVDDNDEPVITAMYLAEVDIWSYHAGYGNYMKVLAWRSLPQPYQPKGE